MPYRPFTLPFVGAYSLPQSVNANEPSVNSFCPHSSNTHEQPSSEAKCLIIIGRTLPLFPYFKNANSEGSGETAYLT